MVRIPNWWRGGKGPRAGVKVTVGDNKSSGFGVDSLLQFRAAAALDGEELTDEEWRTLMTAQESLVLLSGQWVEVDKDKLKSVLAHWKQVQAEAGDGVSFLKGMRMISGVRQVGADDDEAALADWSQVTAGGLAARDAGENPQPAARRRV